MSQEIQLASPYNRNLPMQAEPWAQGGALGASQPQQATPLRRIHRLLRGRYILAFVLAILGAAGGGLWGYLSQEPGYKSTGLIEITPTIPDPDSYDKVMQMYGAYMQSQIARLKSERMAKLVFKRPEWQAIRPANDIAAVQAFVKALNVQHLRGSSLLEVTFADPQPNVAPVAVKAVIETYRSSDFGATDPSFIRQKIEYHTKRRDNALKAIDNAKREIGRLANEAGYGYEDLSVMVEARQKELVNLYGQLRNKRIELMALRRPELQTSELTPEHVAQIDPKMGEMLRTREAIRINIETNLTNLGAKHPLKQKALSSLEQSQREIEAYFQEVRKVYSSIQKNPLGAVESLVPASLEGLEQNLKDMQAFYDTEKEATAELGRKHSQIQNLKAEISDQFGHVKEAEGRIEDFRFQQEMVGQVSVISDGTAAEVSTDNRYKFGLVGFVLGAAMPIGLLMMIGLLDSRYRYSDEAGGVDMQGITLLGILPNLPDRLSDPEQAAIAAHCVHQIRTMLQINGVNTAQDRRVFAVTSASPGDGKTSLTLALGLSYAACGTRTLLIDCDLVGAGLTARMNVDSPEGVLEAIANRSLLEYVRTTDIADVAILPVGSARGHHASTLSPQALRRMIEEAEKHFETILIDTGPILGSIEASLVCAAADGVVLTVARGQNRPLVEKSLGHLQAIGAKLAGVVFNRAQASDFERSISGVSMRSASNGGNLARTGEPQFGPVARAVAEDRNN